MSRPLLKIGAWGWGLKIWDYGLIATEDTENTEKLLIPSVPCGALCG
jgi:hypothetical protein